MLESRLWLHEVWRSDNQRDSFTSWRLGAEPRSHAQLIRFAVILFYARHHSGELKFMEAKLYVGNLPYNTADADLQSMFSAAGTVKSAQVIKDR